MSRLRYVAVFFSLWLMSACGDGGPVGTGISSVAGISGNIADVDDNGQTSGGAGVEISIDGVANSRTVSDSDGSFQIQGDFSGPLTLRFAAAMVTATRELDVPAGSNVVLEDLHISRQGVTEGARRVLGFLGQVALVDCSDGTVLVNDQRPPAHQFLIHLSDDTVITRANGERVTCANISTGNQIAVEGLIGLDRSIDALAVILGPARPGNPAPVQEVRLRGRITLVNCTTGMVLIEDRTTLTRLRLVATTTILNDLGQRIGCNALARHDGIDGSGLINTRRPGVIEAKVIRRRPPLPLP